MRLLALVRTHLAGDGSGESVTKMLEEWTDDERFAALQCVVPLVLSLASEVAPIRSMSVSQLIDLWQATSEEQERLYPSMGAEESS